MTFKKLVLVGAVSLAFAAPAQAVMLGTGGGGNCFPFSCGGGTVYQQVYDDAAFGGPINIGTINFFLNPTYPGALNSGTYTLRLSHSANPVNALNTSTFSANVGGDEALFGTFTIGGAAPSVLSFVGTSFYYDGVGDLLLNISASITSGGSSYFDANNGDAGGVFSRAHNFGSAFEDWGLRTEFAAAAVPEPETYAMLLAGLGLLGFVARRRKQKLAVA